MANFLLVSYAGYPFSPSSLCPDNGLAVLAAVLREAGHDVRIIDFGTVETMRRLYPEELSRRAAPLLMELASLKGEPSPALIQELVALDQKLEHHQNNEVAYIALEVCEQVKQVDPAFVGFKLWNGDGFTGSVMIAETVRIHYPDLPILAGGPQATWAGGVIHERTAAFNAILVGEAEDKIVQLANVALNGGDFATVPGAITEAGQDAPPTTAVDLNDIPRAVYDADVYPAMTGDQKLKMIVLDDSRGCPFCCAFCMHPHESGRKLRTRSAHLIGQDMAGVVEDYGIRTFRFAGSTTPGTLMDEVAGEIEKRDLSVLYTSFAHFHNSMPEHYKRMRESGLYAMFFGLETGSEELLRRATGKPIKPDEIRLAMRAAKDAGIKAICSMIVPMPFETEETLEDSFNLLAEIRPDSVPLQFPGLLPGTAWFNEPEKYGFEVDKESYIAENLDYKIKLLFPPTFWKPLSYKVNGMPYSEFTAITSRFAARLEAEGILTGVPDENMLMAHLAGMTPREFRDQARAWCATGNVTAMEQFVTRYNKAATSPDINP